MVIDESFKRSGSIPFKWEVQPGIPKASPNGTSHAPPLKLRPPPSEFYYSDSTHQSITPTRSGRRLFHRFNSQRSISTTSSVVSSGCFPSPSVKVKHKVGKKNINKAGSELELGYVSDLETLARWSVSTEKSLSPSDESPSFLSERSPPPPAMNSEWAAFGLF
ncbi:hypothetical protein IFM89_001777 [Coptis chinensis]|uniref:Uncharacterized protein n=1 Tax=Coptis chinensis TaxID=261450 RepID=A0A835LUC0_9MAGN|nr:hypothetical protein IFM89_001777 [Coptis chinensis]